MGNMVSDEMGYHLCHSQTHIHMCWSVCVYVCEGVCVCHTMTPPTVIMVVDILCTVSMANEKEARGEETGRRKREKREEQGPERKGYKDKTGMERKAKQLQSVERGEDEGGLR